MDLRKTGFLVGKIRASLMLVDTVKVPKYALISRVCAVPPIFGFVIYKKCANIFWVKDGIF